MRAGWFCGCCGGCWPCGCAGGGGGVGAWLCGCCGVTPLLCAGVPFCASCWGRACSSWRCWSRWSRAVPARRWVTPLFRPAAERAGAAAAAAVCRAAAPAGSAVRRYSPDRTGSADLAAGEGLRRLLWLLRPERVLLRERRERPYSSPRACCSRSPRSSRSPRAGWSRSPRAKLLALTTSQLLALTRGTRSRSPRRPALAVGRSTPAVLVGVRAALRLIAVRAGRGWSPCRCCWGCCAGGGGAVGRYGGFGTYGCCGTGPRSYDRGAFGSDGDGSRPSPLARVPPGVVAVVRAAVLLGCPVLRSGPVRRRQLLVGVAVGTGRQEVVNHAFIVPPLRRVSATACG